METLMSVCAVPRNRQFEAWPTQVLESATSAMKKEPTFHAILQSPYASRAPMTVSKSAAAVIGSTTWGEGGSHPS